MYFIKRFYHVEAATRNRAEVRQWLHDHEGVTWLDWLLGRFPPGIRIDYV